ncbi:hypothetical protein [Anaerotignum sp.]|uniref:hypothetical protein n=1 Tax=Anaerotignum sp. TaxID=2039241 RepID=UPI002714A81B|nr:hypothetical protein [Anaerotignum sp.]
MKKRDRITDEHKEHKIDYLKKLQAYENTGWQPDEITPKPGSVADLNKNIVKPKKHKIHLVSRSTADNKRTFWGIKMDGKELSIDEFGEAIGIKGNTVRSWVTHNVFEQRIREKGLI